MLLKALLAILTAPWVLLWSGLRMIATTIGLPGRFQAMNADTLFCPDGHPNPLMGRWTCNCGANYIGHAFAPCSICGMPAGWVRCESCSLAIRSPWKAS